MAPQKSRINLDFSVSDAKKITKITTEQHKTHINNNTCTQAHNSIAQHNST